MSESTSIKLADGLKQRVQAIAKAKQRSANWVMNEAISNYLSREEVRATWLAELKEAHAEYVRDGRRHLTQDEVEEWMERRKKDPSAPMPPLHK